MLSEKHRASQTAEMGHSNLEISTPQNAKCSFGMGLNKTFENFNPRTEAHVWLSLNLQLGILLRSNFTSLVFQGNLLELSLCISELLLKFVIVELHAENPNLEATRGSEALHAFQDLGDGNFSVE